MDPVETLVIIEKAKLDCLEAIARHSADDCNFEMLCEERAYERLIAITDQMKKSFGEKFEETQKAVGTLLHQAHISKPTEINFDLVDPDIIEELEQAIDRKLSPGNLDVPPITTFSTKNRN